MIKLRILRLRVYPGGPKVITRVFVGGRQEVRARRFYAAGFKGGGGGHEPRNVGSSRR